ncbi:MAG: ACP S-malonyltransferase [Nitriliruptoraceae bacterium]|nr:ACP S-malonyltransferase [Nitriliruptoraceae bacterium]
MTVAFVFPGQGSHRPGALDAWDGHPAADILSTIDEGIARSVRDLDAAQDTGSRTADAQPAIMAASLVAWRALLDAGVTPDLVAGHSLGEYTAAIAAGVTDVRSGSRLVATRGLAMAGACAANPGTMAAVVKLSPDAVQVLVEGIEDLVVANDNAPGQVVVAGTPEAVTAVTDAARDAGGRAVPLTVEGAFHSPAMAPAVDAVREALDAMELDDPGIPLIAGASARAAHTASEVADGLVDGMLAPVRWREVQEALAAAGVTHLVEVGPGKVLTGLAKRTIPDVTRITVESPDDLDAALAALA